MDHPARFSDAIICNTLGSTTAEVGVLGDLFRCENRHGSHGLRLPL